MTPEQFTQLVSLIDRVMNRPYTLTGAADWPILAFLGIILFSVLGFMWRDLRGIIKENKGEATREVDLIWKALKECQHDCCPRRKD